MDSHQTGGFGSQCEHGASENDGRYQGAYNAPFSRCLCCGVHFPYIDSGSFGSHEIRRRTWTPKDRCGACGGQYVETRNVIIARDPRMPAKEPNGDG